MPWARIDDGFDDHPKVLALLEHDDGATAIGLWTLCLTWAQGTRQNGRPRGFVPRSIAERFVGDSATRGADALVRVGLWSLHDDGWVICDDRDLFRWGTGPTHVPWIPQRTRQAVFDRDGHACVSCGAADDLTIDHIYPRLLGGRHVEDNFQTLCRSCNSRKGARVLCRLARFTSSSSSAFRGTRR